METRLAVKKNRYFDSVFLMQVAQRLQEEAKIEQAAVLMGTDKNKQVLSDLGFNGVDIDSAGPSDLIVALYGSDARELTQILDHLDDWLVEQPSKVSSTTLRTLDEGLARQPGTNLAVISIPGLYAAKEARRALERGLNVFLFSSNVPLDEEIALKERARAQGLIVMGPDCGTSLISGVGIGFANAVRRGSIGVIGPSGTGLQEFTTTVHRCGLGISHAIGTGTRDLSDEVGGITTLQAFDVLEADPDTAVIGVVSKPPGARALAKLLERAGHSSKPVAACFLGIDHLPEHAPHLHLTRTIDEAAVQAALLTGGGNIALNAVPDDQWRQWLDRETALMLPEQKYIRGLFAGGTFCYQAQCVLRTLGFSVCSDAPISGMRQLADPLRSVSHTLVDMGAEFFTDGRPHPMIDGQLRRERVIAEANEPAVAVILLDFILGYSASPDPVGEMLEAIVEARRRAANRGAYLPVVASVCGTDSDFQNLGRQTRMLEDAGVVILPTASAAARFSGELVTRIQGNHER